MSAFKLEKSMERAAARLRPRARAPRRDRGRARLDPDAEALLQGLLATAEKPNLSAVARHVREQCSRRGLAVPSRASIYNAVDRARVPDYRALELPSELRRALYNLDVDDELRVPGDLVVFHAFNYGEPRALSFAAGLPWLCLRRALARPGWRPKSRSLLEAVAAYRGL